MAPLQQTTGPAAGRAPFDSARPMLERFDYLSTQRSPALLTLSVRLPSELPAAARPLLVVERDAVEQLFSPRLAAISSVASGTPDAWLWRAVFAVPSQLITQPQTIFAVRFLDDALLALPAPIDRRRTERASGGDGAQGLRRWPYAVRRGALLFVVTCQLCVLPGFSAGALADGAVGTPATVETAPEGLPRPTEERAGEAEEGAGESPPVPVTAPEAPEAAPQPPPEPPQTPTGAPEPRAPGAASESTPPDSPAQPSPTQTESSAPVAAPAASTVSPSARQQPSSTTSTSKRRGERRPRTGALARPKTPASREKSKRQASKVTGDTVSPTARELSAVPIFEGLPPGLANIEANEPPPFLIPIYKQAARRYDVPWRVLAAINEIETDYGRNLSVSSAGALGWMQFMPATWQEWGVDADHDGIANPYSPQDAVFSAARYLQASGAAHDLSRAIFAYNHADWYVAEVLLRAQLLGDKASFARVEQGYALPLQANYMQQLGRTDDGVDIETAPDGALVYSITPGVVSAVAGDPAGFGPNYPVIEATSGSLAGQHIYYGHVAQALVQPGQQVAAGQPIAIVGHTGDAAALGHGHIEIGFSDAGGAPLNQHGAEAWTPAGSVMRAFLVGLAASFGVHSS